ncbi:hypothetical protein [Paraburkholderia caballeronis]|uniref:hypothetical protein n=1 Tax=Paraburkholderia caballeronis TaxID=416943 RepID=UPI001065451C|nr:hypothetical protein [Paraburkholderia caballeronis]TDV17156.1 hypothetical protein C7406_10680 [Paraburkholderia caballeronis]TDV17541.1 hypothetical protein C7408_104201 [Paraburkholderia caballeronis]TDV27559.1 hypothetical protein C7404_104201 [Paraburkholderia caballeronis]
MERLARLLPFRQFGRLRHLRGIASCAARAAQALPVTASLFDAPPAEPRIDAKTEAAPLPVLPSAQPAFARVSLNSGLNAEPAQRAPVRVYHGPSRLIMVGTVDAVCRMIDRCIAEQQAELSAALTR